jgi:hypothetical protein
MKISLRGRVNVLTLDGFLQILSRRSLSLSHSHILRRLHWRERGGGGARERKREGGREREIDRKRERPGDGKHLLF